MSEPDNFCQPDENIDPRASAKLDPRERGISVSSLCQAGHTPIMITGIIRDALIQHFGSRSNIRDPDLKSLIWQELPETGIVIESHTRWRRDLVEKRPALIIKRNKYQSVRSALGDRAGITEDGHEIYTTMWVGSHTVFCLHTSGAAADLLATETRKLLSQNAPIFTKGLGLFSWMVTDVTEISKLKESNDTYVIGITIGWAFDETWILELESMKLRKISFSMLMDGLDFKK